VDNNTVNQSYTPNLAFVGENYNLSALAKETVF